MPTLPEIADFIKQLGFPVVIALVLGYILFKIFKKMAKTDQEQIKRLETRIETLEADQKNLVETTLRDVTVALNKSTDALRNDQFDRSQLTQQLMKSNLLMDQTMVVLKNILNRHSVASSASGEAAN